MAKQVKAVVDEATGLVENIIVVDGAFDPGVGKILVDADAAQIGGTWDGGAFLPPPPPAVPEPSKAELAAKAIEGAAAMTLADLKASVASALRMLE